MTKAKKKTIKKKSQPKKTLKQAVEDSDERLFVIIGALSKANLLNDYYDEIENERVKDIEPSITDDELKKIIKEFRGD